MGYSDFNVWDLHTSLQGLLRSDEEIYCIHSSYNVEKNQINSLQENVKNYYEIFLKKNPNVTFTFIWRSRSSVILLQRNTLNCSKILNGNIIEKDKYCIFLI